jgi:Tfp pilus assembly protein PilX
VQRLNLGTSYQNIASTNSFHSTAEFPESAPDYNSIDWTTEGWDVTQVSDSHITVRPKAMIEEMQNTDSLKTGKGVVNKELSKRYYRVTTFARGDTLTARTTLQGVVVQE